MLSSGDQRAIFHGIESDEPRDYGNSTTQLVKLVLRYHVVKVSVSVFQTAMSTKRTILSLDQRLESLRRMNEAPRVERLLKIQCGKTQMARIEADMTAIMAE